MGKIFSKIKGLLSKLLMIVAVILLALVIINWGSEGVKIFEMPFKVWQLGLLAVVALGLAFIIDGKQAAKVLGSITDGAKALVKSAGDVLGSALSSTGNAITSTIGSWILPVGLLFGGYYIYTKIGEENDSTE